MSDIEEQISENGDEISVLDENDIEDNPDSENDNDNEGDEGDEDEGDISENDNNIQNDLEVNYIDDIDDDDDDNDDYLQKFNENILTKFLEEIHPETKTHNTDEVLGMTKIIRDENGNIIDNNHKTIPILTKYEKTRILGIRAKQINEGSSIFTEISNKIIDGYTIALKEFNEKKIPFIIKRPLPDGSCEYWNLKDLEII
jgi:DNA-directed RNA polymerase I, II, and III subunit RPABC2